MKKGFTLIELLVVIAMIAVLTGAASSSVMRARKRSQIARAETEVREMTNAILAYENYARDHDLGNAGSFSTWTKASKGSLGFILGDGKDGNGKDIPVLYNAAVTAKGELKDPWGMDYEFMIVAAGEAVRESSDKVGKGLETFLYLPNLYWRGGE